MDVPLFLVADPTEKEYNLAQFKVNLQNAGKFSSVDGAQQAMQVVSDDLAAEKTGVAALAASAAQTPSVAPTEFKLHLATKDHAEWEGELVNKEDKNTRYPTPRNYYILLQRDKDKKYGKHGRFIVRLIKDQYLFGKKREVAKRKVEDQTKEAIKEQERLRKLTQDSLQGNLKAPRIIGGASKRSRDDEKYEEVKPLSATGDDFESPGGQRSAARVVNRSIDDDGISEWNNYNREAAGMTDSSDLRFTDAFDPDEEGADFGDEGGDYCGGDNEGMEIDDDPYVDTGYAGAMSDDDEDDDDDLTKRTKKADDSAEVDPTAFFRNAEHDSRAADEEEKKQFEDYFSRFHATEILKSNVPLPDKYSQEVLNHFLSKNKITKDVPLGRRNFLNVLRAWDNSLEKRRELLEVCSKIIKIAYESQAIITVDTLLDIFQRCKGGIGITKTMPKQRILRNLEKAVGASEYREQKGKIDQLFREKLQRVVLPNGDVEWALTAKSTS